MSYSQHSNNPNGTSRKGTEQARVAELIKSMNHKIYEINKEIGELRRPGRDAATCRRKVEEAERVFNGKVQEAEMLLRAMPDGIQKQKLQENLRPLPANLERTVDDFKAQLEEVVAESPVHNKSFCDMKPPVFQGGLPGDSDRQQPLLTNKNVEVPILEQRVAQTDLTDAELDVHSQIVRETADQVAQVAREAVQLNGLMSEVRKITYEQGDVMDSIADHVSNASSSMVDAVPELQQAADRQSRGNKRMWIIVLIVLILAIIFVVILVAISHH